jgi:MOSC domain-containing protein YiiM
VTAAGAARAAAAGPRVVSVGRDAAHRFSKPPVAAIRLLAGLGVEGDAHCGVTVQHRSRVARDPRQPNLRQVHLVHAGLFDELAARGLAVRAGDLGENVCTDGLDLLALPQGTELQLGPEARVQLTGLRNPCGQLDDFLPGLMAAVLDRDGAGRLVRKAGVMAVVLRDGWVRPGDAIALRLPASPHRALEPV